ncbi:MAG: high-affinity branched-chain amino acid ABC transporter permease LivM [Burkholderiaceae bacterium]|jgi:branched-chain amino acid transport system permease protein|nr:high-affinity branched-chain amino acid ABC transporter permease LivM [Burkholderiaceae bacterium]
MSSAVSAIVNLRGIRAAAFAALLTAVLIVPILSLQLHFVDYQLALEPHWLLALVAVVAVFVVQLLRPAFARATQAVRWRVLPPIDARAQRWVLGALLLIGLIWPFFGSRGAVDIGTQALIYVILGLGLNIVVGFAGLLDLGYVGFYAIGGYTYALLNQYFGLSFWDCLPITAAMAALFGFLLGFPVLRLRGDYLAIVTLGFGEIIRLLARNLSSFTGGPDGINGIPKPTLFGIEMGRIAHQDGAHTLHELLGIPYNGMYMMIFMYLVALALVCLTLFVTGRLARMPIGRAWEALREDEIACRSLGLNPTSIKLWAFTLGAAFAGVAGAIFAARLGSVTPDSFPFIESAMILSIVVLGGMGSLLGVALAAIILTVLPELARDFAQYRMLIFGLVMVLMMMWRPQGLLPMRRNQVTLPTQSST